jgi:hypothetical protein
MPVNFAGAVRFGGFGAVLIRLVMVPEFVRQHSQKFLLKTSVTELKPQNDLLMKG